jgi:hypothetical protein
MLVLFSKTETSANSSFLPSPRLPSFLKFAKPAITCASPPIVTMPSTCRHSRQGYSRESSYDSTSSAPSESYTTGTIHHRRTISRTSTSSPLPLPPSLDGFSELFHSRVSTPLITPVTKSFTTDEDRERWARMLRMQREFHCYKSARLEAAVEALDNGASFEEVPIRE